MQKLLYTSPAGSWLEGMPVGTGRLAAMIMGGSVIERVALNHEWLWTARYRDRTNDKCADKLAYVRELLIKGDYAKGSLEANRFFSPRGGCSGTSARIDAYQPAGDLYFELPNALDKYKRELDLETGIVTVTHSGIGNKNFTREYIAHLVEDMLFVRLTAEDREFDGAVWLDRVFDPDCAPEFVCGANRLRMKGQIRGGVKFCVEAKVWHDGGALVECNQKIGFVKAKEIIIAVNIGTSASGKPAGPEAAVGNPLWKNWDELKKTHCLEYRKRFGKTCQLTLKQHDETLDKMPTDQRLERMRRGEKDPGLIQLYFDYGKYLLFAASALAELPANLQGKWNDYINPPWESDYHLDINLQMNYWFARQAGMPDCDEQFFTYVERMMESGRQAAKDLWGCRGIWLTHATDAWGGATPEAYGYTVWMGAAPWLAQHFWRRFEYSMDIIFLRDRAYPFMKAATEFFEDFLFEDAQGILQVVPSQSPENAFVGGGDMPVTLCVSSSMDIQLVMELLTNTISAAKILKADLKQQKKWRKMLDKLPPLKIGKDGRLLEWNREVEEIAPGHRHISHMYGVYPGDFITASKTPELFTAARKSLEFRLNNYGGHTGWSRAWAACLWAAFGEGGKAYECLENLIAHQSSDSLLDLHPPRLFQIDGNLGAVAAVLEMLFKTEDGVMIFLPALPPEFKDGSIRGLHVRGGFTVNFAWKNGKLQEAEIIPHLKGSCSIKSPGKNYAVIHNDKIIAGFNATKQLALFQTAPEENYYVRENKETILQKNGE